MACHSNRSGYCCCCMQLVMYDFVGQLVHCVGQGEVASNAHNKMVMLQAAKNYDKYISAMATDGVV